MGTLEKVMELKTKGISEEKIISQLKEEGINAMEISDSLEQSKIKQAVGKENKEASAENMQPSIMQTEEEETHVPNQNPPQQEYQPQTSTPQEYQPQQEQPYTPQQPQQYYPENNFDPNYAYEDSYNQEPTNQDNSYYSNESNTETMIEIAEQVFSEKMKDLEKEMRDLKEFKTIYKSKIDDIDERIKRIEKMFDKMQIAILDKVGSFAKNITHLQKEVEMVEDSITKLNKKK
ncbi:MAG: hypothetical protein U9Q99_02965 [Nanoarchaeota archaeon]|nr:hypothetical protein [Nanoarchaeota archaeon]